MLWENIDNLSRWLRTHRQRLSPAPIYELASAREVRTRILQHGQLEWALKSLRSESATLDLMPDVDLPVHPLRIANLLDEERRFVRSDPVTAGGIPLVQEEWEGVLHGLPAVGPGGRVTVYHRALGDTVDITVRVRKRRITSIWRRPRDVEREVRGFINDYPSAVLSGKFGYYDASKYERQTILRPTYVFLLEGPTADQGPRWRVAIALPATEAPDLPPTAGLDTTTTVCQ